MYPVMMSHARTMGEIDEALENPNISRRIRLILLIDRKLTLRKIARYLEEIDKVMQS